MLHQTPYETTPNHYESSDGKVTIRALDRPKRFPPSDYKVCVFRLEPKDNTRIRRIGPNLYEYMPTLEELGAFLSLYQRLSGKDLLHYGEPFRNKPPERKLWWDRFNRWRFIQHLFARHNRHSY